MVGGLRSWAALVAACLVFAAVLVVWFKSSIPPIDEMPGAKARLVLVETQSFDSDTATITLYERGSDSGNGGWKVVGERLPATVGRNGLGWGHTFRHLAGRAEPIKQEGDKRAPAGIFKLGRPFGLLGDNLSGYMQLGGGQHFCVDDVASKKYSEIVPMEMVAEGTSGERMWEISLYRRGIVVDYPTNRAAKSGSCIFVHVWETPQTPTSGCVATSEVTVARLQEWVSEASGGAWIAIVPRSARDRLERLGLNLPE